MNTADRSIALIDAAMRRRFHFVPFFPHEGMMKDLLRRWLADGNRRTAIADFLDAVNQELLPLVGEHLLIGPSHFMKADPSENALRRIWTYNVFPLIEEQFWGDQDSRTPDRGRIAHEALPYVGLLLFQMRPGSGVQSGLRRGPPASTTEVHRRRLSSIGWHPLQVSGRVIARPGQDSLGVLTCRWSTATW
jgi:hypothetical protein